MWDFDAIRHNDVIKCANLPEIAINDVIVTSYSARLARLARLATSGWLNPKTTCSKLFYFCMALD